MNYSGTLESTQPSFRFEANGAVTLRTSPGEEWSVDAKATVKKRVLIGSTNAEERPPYRMEVLEQDDGVMIRPEPRPNLEGAGILYIRETLRHDVTAPAAAAVALRIEEGDVETEASFRQLEIDLYKGSITLRLDRSKVGDVRVTTRKGSISVNDEEQGGTFTMDGAGENRVAVRVQKGDVTILTSGPSSAKR